MTTLERRVQRLEDRIAIEELIARYGLAMDNRDVAAFPDLFTPDIVLRSGDGVMDTRGLEAVTAMFEGRFRVLGPSNHFTHDKIIRFAEDDPDLADGFLVSHAEMNRKGQPMLAAMRYHDRFRRHEGVWKFAERLLTFFYYVPTCDYLDALGPGLATRNRAYDTATRADWPEPLPTWKRYYG